MKTPHTEGKFQITRLGIIGLGLIGGSLAKALRKVGFVERVIVADADSDSVKSVLDDGFADEAVDINSPDFHSAFDGCDALFICIPPHSACEMIPKFRDARIGIITDVTSVKTPIMDAARGMCNFIGGHPMAGSEGSGYVAADPDLFNNSIYIICRCKDCTLPREKVEAYKRLLEAIGAMPITMDATAHDCRIAVISHMPHLAAFALAAMADDTHDATLRAMIGGGFKDTTRIAASSPDLWTDILTSSPNLTNAIDEYINKLQRLKGFISDGDAAALREFLASASAFRASIPEGLRAPRRAETLK